MNLNISELFVKKLNLQVEYIARDKPSAAKKFKESIFKIIKEIPKNPEKCRKSIFFDNDEIRDLVFKSYIIVYRIDYKNNSILVFGFIRYEQNPFKKLF